jgi:hypothetical protein
VHGDPKSVLLIKQTKDRGPNTTNTKRQAKTGERYTLSGIHIADIDAFGLEASQIRAPSLRSKFLLQVKDTVYKVGHRDKDVVEDT